MKCGFCNQDFDPAEAETACRSCPLMKGCKLIRCPHCGYEMPPEPRVIGWLRNLKKKVSAQPLGEEG